MAGFLLDTTVVSELMKKRPNTHVLAWVGQTPEPLMHLSVLTIGEVWKGITLLADDDPAKVALPTWLEHDLRIRFAGRLLTFDDGVAERWGRIEALARRRRSTLPTIDAQLAATALHHGLTFATRNTVDVAPTGVSVFNPWLMRG